MYVTVKNSQRLTIYHETVKRTGMLQNRNTLSLSSKIVYQKCTISIFNITAIGKRYRCLRFPVK